MTDLCYNCGSCHLPQKCAVPLNPCDICKQWGHTWNFCHLGPHQRQADYQYYALCHNCDRWHLPDPCTVAAYKCRECNQLGHLPCYCPVRPGPRLDAINNSPERESNSEDSMLTALSRFTTQEILHTPAFARDLWTIKMIAVRDALELAKLYPTEEVYRCLSDAYDGVHLPSQPVAGPSPMRTAMPPPTTNHEGPMARYQGHHRNNGYSGTSTSHAAHATPGNSSRFIPNQTPQESGRGGPQLDTPVSMQGHNRSPLQPTVNDTYQRIFQGLNAYNSPVNGRPSATEKPYQDLPFVNSPDVASTSSVDATSMTGTEGPLEDGGGANGHAGSQNGMENGH